MATYCKYLLYLSIFIFNLNFQSVLAATDCSAVTEVPQVECEALVALWDSTDGANWTDAATNNWNMNNTPCSWEGVYCSNDHVTIISLSNNQLAGNIPPEIGNLNKLEKLLLFDSQLIGNIPPELWSLVNLTDLWLCNNQLVGNIPPEIGNLNKLESLLLCDNQLTGDIPSEVGSLSNLKKLFLNNNQLTGNIPSELWNLVNLTDLFLSKNQLTGNIPPEVGSLSKLEHLNSYNNQLIGDIPSELWTLVNLTDLYLSNNQLTGSIPFEVENLTKLKTLSLSNNQLTGNIPSEIWKLTNLTYINLSSNQLIGNIPTELGDLVNLTYINLSSNQLTGNISSDFGKLKNLTKLYLRKNKLTDTLNLELTNLTELEELDLSFNYLNGDTPSSSFLPMIQNLSLFKIDNNCIFPTDSAVIAALNNKDPAWNTTQTNCSESSANYALTTNQTGTGTGVITGEGNYLNNTEISLIANANIDSIFASWSCTDGYTSTTAETSFVMPSHDVTCTATFELKAADIEIDSVTPETAIIGEPTIFTVKGSNIDKLSEFNVQDCLYPTQEIQEGSSETRQFVCTLYGLPGTKSGVIKNSNGESIFDFEVESIIPIKPNIYVNSNIDFLDLENDLLQVYISAEMQGTETSSENYDIYLTILTPTGEFLFDIYGSGMSLEPQPFLSNVQIFNTDWLERINYRFSEGLPVGEYSIWFFLLNAGQDIFGVSSASQIIAADSVTVTYNPLETSEAITTSSSSRSSNNTNYNDARQLRYSADKVISLASKLVKRYNIFKKRSDVTNNESSLDDALSWYDYNYSTLSNEQGLDDRQIDLMFISKTLEVVFNSRSVWKSNQLADGVKKVFTLYNTHFSALAEFGDFEITLTFKHACPSCMFESGRSLKVNVTPLILYDYYGYFITVPATNQKISDISIYRFDPKGADFSDIANFNVSSDGGTKTISVPYPGLYLVSIEDTSTYKKYSKTIVFDKVAQNSTIKIDY